MNKFDLTWGESVCVRQAFVDTLSIPPIVIGPSDLIGFGYPKHEGHPEIIRITREVIKRQTGREYAHVILTNGATGGVTITMRALRQRGYNAVFTLAAPYFSLYPSMIKAAGFERHRREAELIEHDDKPIFLLDSPSNPAGHVISGPRVSQNPIIWDAVYHTKVYAPLATPIEHDVMVGSYSKLTGVNGLRIGWIATDDFLLYQRLYELVTAEYCGLGSGTAHVFLSALNDPANPFDWTQFEARGRLKLDDNRGQFSKLEKFFGNNPVKPIGMFYYAPMDVACKKLMEKAGVQWMPGSSMGASDNFGRFNLGQDNKIIADAVKSVLKADKI